jgi:LacI family transcriptional regulator
MAIPATIRDIAAVAGVHFTTVSLVLRNDPRITAATAGRVRAAAEKLGYRPNPMVTALMTSVRVGRRKRLRLPLGFCTHWENEEGWKKVRSHRLFFEGASQRADTTGYRVEHFNLARPGMSAGRWSQIFKTRNIRGLILASFQNPMHELPLEWKEFSAVRIDPNPKNPHLDTVCTNQSQIVRVAFRQARARGYERIGLASHQLWDERLGDAILAGYLVEQASVRARLRLPAFRTYDWTAESFAKWYRLARPDALIAMNDAVVLGWLGALGVRVPRDLGYISLDQTDETEQIAGMRKNHTLLGANAVDLLVAKLQHNERGVPDFPCITLVGGKWIDGASVRALPKGAGDPTMLIG